MNKKIILTLAILSIFLISIISAERFVNYKVNEGVISIDGISSETSNQVNDFKAIGFVCLDSGCNNVGNALWNGNPISSTGNNIQLTYPTTLQSTYGYAVYFYKEGYIPWEQNPNWWGTNSNDPQGPYTKYLNKKESCHAPIEQLNVVNEAYPNVPVVIDMDVKLDAVTYAAIRSSGPLNYVPSSLQEHYSVKTKVTLRITDHHGNLVKEESKEILIPYSGLSKVNFEWLPEEIGEHNILVSTDVLDSKCSSSIEEATAKEIRVISNLPRNMCYTLLNNLSTSTQFPKQGDIIKVSANKISNYADNNYDLTPVDTFLILEVAKVENGEVVEEKQISLEKNSNNFNFKNFDFDLKPILDSGWYTITLSGIANSSLCAGLENNPEAIARSIYVEGIQSEDFSVSEIKIYSDENFTTEKNEFLRGEQMFVKFSVIKDNQLQENAVLELKLKGNGGEIELTKISEENGIYQYKLNSIALTPEFLGNNFRLYFKFSDGSIDEYPLSLTINNNNPVIKDIPKIKVKKNERITLDLSKYGEDAETPKENLVWEIISYNNSIITAELNGNTLIVKGIKKDNTILLIRLKDSDGSYSEKNISIEVTLKGNGGGGGSIIETSEYKPIKPIEFVNQTISYEVEEIKKQEKESIFTMKNLLILLGINLMLLIIILLVLFLK